MKITSSAVQKNIFSSSPHLLAFYMLLWLEGAVAADVARRGRFSLFTPSRRAPWASSGSLPSLVSNYPYIVMRLLERLEFESGFPRQ